MTTFEVTEIKDDYVLNPETVDTIRKGLERNKEKHGIALCPCRLYPDIEEEKKTLDNICPCKEFRETKHCHCNLYILKETAYEIRD